MKRENRSQNQKWIIYALGGGWGHLTRALSLARIAARFHQVEILCNSPYLHYVQTSDAYKQDCRDLDLTITDFSHPSQNSATARSPSLTDEELVATQISSKILNSNCDRLIVDTFPRGLLGELVNVFAQMDNEKRDTHAHRVLISRALNQRYRTKFQIDDFIDSHYHMVIEPGDVTEDNGKYVRTAPWLVRSSDELPSRNEMRSRLGISDSERLVVIVSSGTSEEQKFYHEVARQASRRFEGHIVVRCLTPVCPADLDSSTWISHWPGIECIAAADVVVGSAGYNTINECAALDIPLVAVPFKRLYDCQDLRALQATSQAIDVSQVLDSLSNILEVLADSQSTQTVVPSYVSGANEAYRLCTSRLPNLCMDTRMIRS